MPSFGPPIGSSVEVFISCISLPGGPPHHFSVADELQNSRRAIIPVLKLLDGKFEFSTLRWFADRNEKRRQNLKANSRVFGRCHMPVTLERRPESGCFAAFGLHLCFSQESACLSQNSNSTARDSLSAVITCQEKGLHTVTRSKKPHYGVSNPLIRFSYLPYKPYIHIHHTTTSSSTAPPYVDLTPSSRPPTPSKPPPCPRRSSAPTNHREGTLENAQKQTERRNPFPPPLLC